MPMSTLKGITRSEMHPPLIRLAEYSEPSPMDVYDTARQSAARTTATEGYVTEFPASSFKCGIYSGICVMMQPGRVGDYCVCQTPSGLIHGVIVP